MSASLDARAEQANVLIERMKLRLKNNGNSRLVHNTRDFVLMFIVCMEELSIMQDAAEKAQLDKDASNAG